ncbi:GYD domain-containing protein [Candidatus Poribacteria bacterium]|nr:GYD domain-containing protein [Candidatus Poribacteria bacterium]
MGHYIMLSNLTDHGAKTVKENPGRIKEVDKEVEAMGVKILAQYAVMGPYDFVNIVEAPDNETVMRVSMELSARGSVKFTTLTAIPIDEFIDRLKNK